MAASPPTLHSNPSTRLARHHRLTMSTTSHTRAPRRTAMPPKKGTAPAFEPAIPIPSPTNAAVPLTASVTKNRLAGACAAIIAWPEPKPMNVDAAIARARVVGNRKSPRRVADARRRRVREADPERVGRERICRPVGEVGDRGNYVEEEIGNHPRRHTMFQGETRRRKGVVGDRQLVVLPSQHARDHRSDTDGRAVDRDASARGTRCHGNHLMRAVGERRAAGEQRRDRNY